MVASELYQNNNKRPYLCRTNITGWSRIGNNKVWVVHVHKMEPRLDAHVLALGQGAPVTTRFESALVKIY